MDRTVVTFFKACMQGDVKTVKAMMKTSPRIAISKTDYSEIVPSLKQEEVDFFSSAYPAHHAAAFGQLNILKIFHEY